MSSSIASSPLLCRLRVGIDSSCLTGTAEVVEGFSLFPLRRSRRCNRYIFRLPPALRARPTLVKEDSMIPHRSTRRAFLAASLAAAAAPLAAQGIPQLGPSRTFDLPADSQVGEPSVVTAVAVSPDGRLIAAAGDDHLVHLWSLADSRHIQTFRGHVDWIRSLSFSMDGTRLASGGDDHRICLWDIPGGKLSRSIGGNERAIYCVRYSPDGRTLATVGFDRQLKLYEAATGDLATVLACPGADMRAVTFSDNGSLMATAGRNGQLRVWNTAEHGVVFDKSVQDRRIRALAFSSDGAHLAVAGEMPHVLFVDSRSGEALGSLPNPAGRVLSMVYTSPHTLATGS